MPSKELTAPIFWHSLLPLCWAVWKWVAIQYLSALPPPPPLEKVFEIRLWLGGGGVQLI